MAHYSLALQAASQTDLGMLCTFTVQKHPCISMLAMRNSRRLRSTHWEAFRIALGWQVWHAVQVITPLILTFLVLVLAAALALWTSASGAVVIWATLISVGLMGATTALLQGGLFGLAGLCPPIYVQARSCPGTSI